MGAPVLAGFARKLALSEVERVGILTLRFLNINIEDRI
jgi:hypothetical protein